MGWRCPCRRCPGRCRGSARTARGAGRRSSAAPSVAEGSMPRQPVSTPARSDSTSPNRLLATMTSNCRAAARAAWRSCRHTCSQLDVGDIRALWTSPTTAAPDPAGLHDIGLLDAGHLVLALARQVEGDAGDAGDLVLVCRPRCRRRGACRRAASRCRAARRNRCRRCISRTIMMSTPRTTSGFSEQASTSGVQHDRRAQVGEQAEVLAQPQDAELRPLVEGQAVPVSGRRRAEQHGVGRRAPWPPSRPGSGDAARVDGGAADQASLDLEGHAAAPLPSSR